MLLGDVAAYYPVVEATLQPERQSVVEEQALQAGDEKFLEPRVTPAFAPTHQLIAFLRVQPADPEALGTEVVRDALGLEPPQDRFRQGFGVLDGYISDQDAKD